MLDTIHRIETPEGVDLDLRVAGPAVRSVAWLIDLVIRLVAVLAIATPLAFLGHLGMGMFWVMFFAVEEFYAVVFEVLFRGAPPGKRLMGIQVVHADGTPVGWAASLLRNLLRAADFLPFFYGVGLVSMSLSTSFQRLGDLAAGTLVVYCDEGRHHGILPEATPRPAPLPLALAEQRVVISFAQRSRQLSQQRSEELAEIAAPLVAASPGRTDDPVRHLYGIAAWLVGRRAPAANESTSQ